MGNFTVGSSGKFAKFRQTIAIFSHFIINRLKTTFNQPNLNNAYNNIPYYSNNLNALIPIMNPYS